MSKQSAHERILLFIPMYNCAPQIPRVIAQLTPDVCSVLSEVIVVNNRSTDDGQAAAISALAGAGLPAKVLLNDGNYGLGGSHKVAFNHALAGGFDYVIVLHGDDQGSIADILPLLKDGAHRNVDCLLGARFMKNSQLRGYSALRTFGNHVFNALYGMAAGKRIHDLGSGLNLYRVAALRDGSWLRNANDLTFNYYQILRSIALEHRIRFFPLEWREDDQVSNVKMFRQSLRVLRIVTDYFLKRKPFLAADHSGKPDALYPSTVVYSSTQALVS